ncbi:MAG: hypothetical protein U0354_01415 [Candidatus Sericytochromatia bacterium]
MDGQVKLTGLNINEPKKLMPPSQLLAQTQTNENQPEVTTESTQETNKSELQNTDQKNISNIVSSAAGSIMGVSSVVRDLGTIGESMRSLHVQNSMSELQDRRYSDTGYGSRSYGRNSYNDYGYDADYGATEFVRRRGYGRVEFSRDRRFGKIENDSMLTPENKMAASNIAKGTFQGAKYGVIIGGAVSSVVNAYKVLTGKEKGASALGTVAADTVTAGVSGGLGALSGGIASVGLASALGLGGPVGMAIAVGVGAVGAIGGQMLMTKTGIYDSIKEKVQGMVSKK